MQNMLPHQPLISFVTGHNPLPHTLGLPPTQLKTSAANNRSSNKLARAMMPIDKPIQVSNLSSEADYALSPDNVETHSNVGISDSLSLNNIDAPHLAYRGSDQSENAISQVVVGDFQINQAQQSIEDNSVPDQSIVEEKLQTEGAQQVVAEGRGAGQLAWLAENTYPVQQNVELDRGYEPDVAPDSGASAPDQSSLTAINQTPPGVEEEQCSPEANLVQQPVEDNVRRDQKAPAEVIHSRRRNVTEYVRNSSNGASNDLNNGQLANAATPTTIGKKTEPENQPVNSVQSAADALFAPREKPRSSEEWFNMLRHSRWGDLKMPAAEPVSAALPSTLPTGTALSRPWGQATSRTEDSTNRSLRGRMEMRPEDRSAFDHAEPLSMRTRRFLRPLVGFDPVHVRVHRGSSASRLAAAHRADAVTLGDDIALAAGYPDDQPQTLGLLAHELTHVARHHEPRFVPPVVSSHDRALTSAAKINSSHKASAGASSAAILSTRGLQVTANEEALAEHIEQQVTRLAEEERKHTPHHAPELVDHASVAQEANRENHADPSTATQHTNWGGLPAPWEPLPDWFVSSQQATEQSSNIPDAPFLPQSSSLPGNISSNGASNLQATVAGSSSIQRAGTERSQHTIQAQAPEQPHESNTMQSPEPDLDELAQQVYSLLKRRLGVERRRMS
jgi:hypothetical protein